MYSAEARLCWDKSPPPEHGKLLEHREEAPSENQRLRKVAQVDTEDYGEILGCDKISYSEYLKLLRDTRLFEMRRKRQ